MAVVNLLIFEQADGYLGGGKMPLLTGRPEESRVRNGTTRSSWLGALVITRLRGL